MTTPSTPSNSNAHAQSHPPADPAGAHKEASTLQGSQWDMTDPAKAREAIEQAFDYRGDVTVTMTDGTAIEGYLYDRRTHPGEPLVRLMPKDGSARRTVLLKDIRQIVFTGRDTASGKSWETWMKKYHEKKAKGEAANIEADELD